jgi:hypothetical protein
MAVFRPESGEWFVHSSAIAITIYRQFGLPGDIPAALKPDKEPPDF